MSRFLQSTNGRFFAYVAFALAVVLIWSATEAVQAKVQALQPKKIRAVQTKVVTTDSKGFYPVLLKADSVLKAESEVREPSDLDALFRTKKEEVQVPGNAIPPKPPEPNYREVVRQMANPDGVTSNGAVLNGRFYKLGEPMPELTVTRPNGTAIVPVLMSVNPAQVEIKVDREVLVLYLNDRPMVTW